MPFYEMNCECDYVEEMLLDITTNLDKVICPKCGKFMKQKITTGNFILKGYNWASKGNVDKPHRVKQTGYRIDHDMKNEMKLAGEKV